MTDNDHLQLDPMRIRTRAPNLQHQPLKQKPAAKANFFAEFRHPVRPHDIASCPKITSSFLIARVSITRIAESLLPSWLAISLDGSPST